MKTSHPALVIDDEPQVSGFVAEVLSSEGWSVSQAPTAGKAFELLEKQQWLLVFCDVMLGEIDGYAVLRRFADSQPKARFIMMTGHGSAAGALDATSIGAYDYLIKPFSVDDILAISRTIVKQRQLDSKSRKSDTSLDTGYVSDIPLIGQSPKFVECLKLVGRVAATSLSVLIVGESGTGKEIVARAIHQRSNRASRPFVTVNCGAIPAELIESELFGHSKGSFTGAERERMGLWEEADGGTIFLDEITETSPMFQVKILRTLQQGEIRRVGSNRNQKIDVRVIAATNRDIEEEVKQGRFRKDLMYRLNAVTVDLPPLHERPEDIPLLAEHFAAGLRPANSEPIKFSAPVLELFRNYAWPGNIRELENAVLHAGSLCDHIVYPEHLPQRLQEAGKSPEQTPEPIRQAGADWLSLAEIEKNYAEKVLAHTEGNKQAAARILNVDRKTLSRIINRNDQE